MRKLFAVAATVAISACATSSQMPAPAPEVGSVANGTAAQWTTILSSEGGSGVTGGASASTSVSGETLTKASISGATAGDVHPWHIHVGVCGGNGPIVGPAAAYPPLTVGADGTATESASIPVQLTPGIKYYVNVHKSAADMGTIVACGNLNTAGM